MKIHPTYVTMDGVKEIEIGNNQGIEFGREPNPELLLKAELHQMAAQNRNIDFVLTRIGNQDPDYRYWANKVLAFRRD